MNNIFSRLLLFGTFIIISCNENSKEIIIQKVYIPNLKGSNFTEFAGVSANGGIAAVGELVFRQPGANVN